MSFQFLPVTKGNWGDFEDFLMRKGSPYYCWCTLWREMDPSFNKSSKEKIHYQRTD
jgi:hypothetical protein